MDIFDHHNRAIDNQSEVDGAETHQIPRHPIQFIPMNAASIESGITAATIRLARISPRNRKSNTETRIAPSARLCATVLIVRGSNRRDHSRERY